MNIQTSHDARTIFIKKPVTFQVLQDLLWKLDSLNNYSSVADIGASSSSSSISSSSSNDDNVTVREPLNKRQRTDSFNGNFSSLRLLVAEDNPLNQRIMGKMLSSIGIANITIVNNGLEAFSAVSQKLYDLVLMDVMMPLMGGIEATEKIRKEVNQNHQPLIIGLTADAFKENQDNCIRAGMNGFLTKPIGPTELTKALKEYVLKR